jgi:dCMP deaminase
MKILIAHIPVIHAGYLAVLEKYTKTINAVYILNKEFVDEFSGTRDIRALNPIYVVEVMNLLCPIRDHRRFSAYRLLTPNVLSADVKGRGYEIVLVNDEIVRKFAAKYLSGEKLSFDTAFLRWDSNTVFSRKDVNYHRKAEDAVSRKFMSLAIEEVKKTSDWWRQVGAVLVKNGVIFMKAHNRHIPTEHAPYFNGDPRDVIEAGKMSELSSAIHAEQAIISAAARKGISLKGTDLYVTVFPCPVCSKMLAETGIKRLFFASGHASLDGEEAFKEKEVEIIYCPMNSPDI